MNVLTQVFLPISLAIIMFSLGITLVVEDFKRVVVQPKDFALGAVSQIVLLPLIAFVLVSVWPIEPALAVGVMIIAACPGGVTSNLLTYLARGDTALSVSLTAVISIISVVTIPIIVSFALGQFADEAGVELSIGSTVIGIFLITTVPVIIGMLVKGLRPGFAERTERPLRIAATVLFIVIVLGAILRDRHNIVPYFVQAGPVTLVLNVVMMALAFYGARLFRLGRRQGIAISLECGLQNGTLGIFVAATLLGNTTMLIPSAIYSLIMFATAGVFIFAVTRARPAPAETG